MKTALLCICLLHGIMESNSNLMKYLDDRARIVGEELIRHGRKQDIYSVKFDDVNSVRLIGKYSSGEIFSFFGETYSVIDNEVYHISGDSYRKYERFLPTERLVLFKTTEFEEMGFLMVATQSEIVHVFGYNIRTKSFFKIQNIMHQNITDAIFLENQLELYLIVSSSTSLVLYKFVNTHFDETERLLTSGASRLHAFKNKGSEIVVALQKFRVASSLFEFKSQQMRKIQKIDVESPEEILSYVHLGKQHVMVFSGPRNVTLYLWTKSDLSTLGKFTTEFDPSGPKSVFYVQNTPYLLIVKDSDFLILSLTDKPFSQIYTKSNTNWTHILSYKFFNQSNILTALGKTNDSVEIKTVFISIEPSSHENFVEDEQLSTCFLTLEKSVYVLRNKITETENHTAVLRESMGERTEDGFPLKKYEMLLDKYFKIKQSRESLGPKKLVIDKSSIIDIPLGAKKVIAKDIFFDNLNDRKWQPDKWLSYNKSQKISGPFKAQMLQTNELRTNNNATIFKNLLLSKGEQVLTGHVKVRTLAVTHLETKFINNIPIENFYFKSQPVAIQGLKSFPQMNVKNLDTANINGVNATKIVKYVTNNNLSRLSHLSVHNLWVENINGVNFDSFRNSVFRIGLTDTINGNLNFTSLRAKEMTFKTLSKMSDVLTASTNQTITSSINIAKIFAKKIGTHGVNGMDFRNSVATLDNATINGPVTIKNLNISNNLNVQGNVDNEFLLFNDTHIVGTNESDFLQRYNGNVTIKGNLVVRNFHLGKSAKIFLSGAAYDPKMDQFWTKTSPQIIPTHFEAQNGVSAPHLLTKVINQVDVSDYLLNSTEQKKSAKFYLDCAIVKGNVVLDQKEVNSPDFEKIQKEGVKIDGSFTIKGHKTYSNILKVDRLEFGHLEHQNVSEMFGKNAPIGDLGAKKILNLTITGDLKAGKISVEKINNVSLINLSENAVYIDRPQNVSQLDFENVTAKNLLISSTINKMNVSKLITKLKSIHEVGKIHSVFISGAVNIKNVENLATINGHNVTELLLKRQSRYHNDTVYNKVKFLGNVKVKDLYIVVVNDVNLENLTRRIFYKSWNQNITAPFTFTKLVTNNLTTEQINEFHINRLIDVTREESQEIYASDGLTMSEHTKIKNLFGNFGCDIAQSVQNLQNPPPQVLDGVTITGNVTFWDREALPSRIFEHTVTRENRSLVITGEVNFRNHISANNITALDNINDVDTLEMINDAFLNRPGLEQVIAGKKVFAQLEAEELVSLQNTNVSQINDIDVLEIDSKIISKNSLISVPIKGRKSFFGGLQTQKIRAEFISGVEAKNLVSFENLRPIPNAMFESIGVDDFNITFINGMPFETVLNERLLRRASQQTVTGNYFFSDVIFNGNITTPQINDIKIEDVVVDSGTQMILASKKFTNHLKIAGNMTVDLINGVKMSEAYEKAVLKNEDTNFTGVVRIMKPLLLEGNIQTKYINNVPVEYMTETNARYSLETEAQEIHEIIKIISGFIHRYLNTTKNMPTEILYLEKFRDLQYPLPNTIDAQIVETKNEILIQLESEEDGSSCGLPEICRCPMQQIMQISPDVSINRLIDKAMQRTYNYYSDDVNVHVITHSVSTNSRCRTSKTKVMQEFSSVSWNVPPQENATGGFYTHRALFQGYISGVEFFTIYGRTYIIVGVYYDPVLDTHELNTIVLRFNKDKTALEEIQKIPTIGMMKISLFPTAQGVVLVMASGATDDFNNTSTQIFRFNEEKQQFQLIREIPMFGSLHAQGVVLEMDSLIILANKFSTLLILKYHPDFDNYYLYQRFQLDYPVTSMSVFYAQGFGISDAYLSVLTTNNEYFIYSFWFIEGWKLEFSGKLDGVRILVPFRLKGKFYLFAPSDKASSLLTLVEHDSN